MKKLPTKITPAATKQTEPRALLIARLRDELQSGTYRLDPEAIARALLSHAHDSSRRTRAAPLNLQPLAPIGVRKH